MFTSRVWMKQLVVTAVLSTTVLGVGSTAGAEPESPPDTVVMVEADSAIAADLTLATDRATIGFETIPAPNAPGSCEITVLSPIFAQPDCTLFAGGFQAPPGENIIRSASVFAGPNPGPMRFEVLQALRSQSGAGGIICCISVAQSQVFVPVPNQINTIEVELPFNNEVIDIDGENVEVIDQLAISVLAPGTSLPVFASPQFFPMSSFNPSIRPGEQRILSSASTFPFSGGALPTISAVACSVDGDSPEDICQQVGEAGDSFTGLNPNRLLDTRGSGRVAAGSTTPVQVGGAAGVPAGAAGAVLNVTAVNPSDGGFLTVFPCGEAQPNSSNLNFVARQTVANAVAATIGDGGEVCVFSSVETDLLVDLNGALTSGFAGLTPERLLDTRASTRVGAGSTTQIRVDNAAGVPGGAVAAVLNVTAVNPSDGGFLTVFPCGESQPNASNVNFVRGQTVANAVAATLGTNGSVCVFSSVETHLLADLNGVFT